MKEKMFRMMVLGFFASICTLILLSSKLEAKRSMFEIPGTIQMFMGEITDVEIGECKDSIKYFEYCDWVEITMNDDVIWTDTPSAEDLEVGDRVIGIINVRTGVVLDFRCISEEYIDNEFKMMSNVNKK